MMRRVNQRPGGVVIAWLNMAVLVLDNMYG